MGFTGERVQVAHLLLVVLPSFVLFGYNQSGLGALLTVSSFVETLNLHDSTIQGVVVATVTLGALCGSLACSWIGDPLGRRKTVLLAAILTFIGEVLECTSYGLAQFVVGRFIIGLGVGALSSTVTVWQSECSQAKNRGRIVVLDGQFICVGYMMQAWINLGCYQIRKGQSGGIASLAWRLPLAVPALVSIVLIASTYAFPESPRWLAGKGRYKQARRSLSILRNNSEDSYEVTNELAAIEIALEETTRAARKRDLFTMGEDKIFYRFMLCIVLQFLQQWCGSNLVSSYSTTIFQNGLGLNSETARILAGASLTWKYLCSWIAFFAIDRFGRRKLFMVSGAGMSLCMMALAITTSMPTSNKSAQYAAVAFVFLFNTFDPIGFLGCNYLYVTEIAPPRLRMPMTSFSTANHWLWNFVVLMVTPVAIKSIGYQYYIVFAVLGACIPILVFLLYPETMGRSLEQMDALFRDNGLTGAVRASLKRPECDLALSTDDRKDEDSLQFEDKALSTNSANRREQ